VSNQPKWLERVVAHNPRGESRWKERERTEKLEVAVTLIRSKGVLPVVARMGKKNEKTSSGRNLEGGKRARQVYTLQTQNSGGVGGLSSSKMVSCLTISIPAGGEEI